MRPFQVGGGLRRGSSGDGNRDWSLSPPCGWASGLCRDIRRDLCRLLWRGGQLFTLPHSCRLLFLMRCVNRDRPSWPRRELDSALEPCHSERWMSRFLGSPSHIYSSADGTSTLATCPQRLRGWCDRRTLPAENHSRAVTRPGVNKSEHRWRRSGRYPTRYHVGGHLLCVRKNEWIVASCVSPVSSSGRTSARGGQSGWYRGQ
jgi:hypothetical protein